ncbi:hypothetical protein LZ31DRAFT_562647 [Colletotrichum somersetense]|nr:hypothetical protein LZ31DRAFT_562647 [Colletotrichum somersetense]
MSCDIRPVITSTKTLYVNPYEPPPTCPCAGPSPSPSSSAAGDGGRWRPLAASSERCPSHGCCTLDVAVHRCARRCRNPTKYNRYLRGASPFASYRDPSSYTQRRRRPSYPHSSPHPSKPLPPNDPFETRQPSCASPWRRLRTFDRDPDFRAVESCVFRLALAELLEIGRVLLHAEAEIDKARLRAERERVRHRAAHGAACERVLREWECGWTRRIAEMVVGADDLALSAEVLADCWVRYVGLLRRYEELGQRRVGGIVEDGGGRGSRRGGKDGGREDARLDEEARPWRYVRRESWDLKERDGEGRREEVCAREGCCQPEPGRRRHSVRFDDEVEPRRKSKDGSPTGKRHRRWWGFS